MGGKKKYHVHLYWFINKTEIIISCIEFSYMLISSNKVYYKTNEIDNSHRQGSFPWNQFNRQYWLLCYQEILQVLYNRVLKVLTKSRRVGRIVFVQVITI